MCAYLALIVSIFAAISFAPVQALSQDIGSVQGRVLSQLTEIPLRGVKLYLVPAVAGPAFQSSTESRQNGSFQFEQIAAGRYLVLQEDEMTAYLKWHGQSTVALADRAAEVRAGQISTLVLIHLNVGAIIQGRVTGPDNQPIAGLQVTASRSLTTEGVARIMPFGDDTTWQDGTYQILHLPAGTYSIAADVKRPTDDGIETQENNQVGPAESFVRTFYSGAPDGISASPITVAADQVFSDADIQMRRGSVYGIRGVVVDAPEGHSYKVYIQRKLDVSTLRMIKVADDRSFSIGGLSPGTYGLELLDTTPGLHIGPAVLAHTEVEVKTSDVQDVQLALQPLPFVVAHLTVSGFVDVEQLRLYLRPTSNPTAPIVFSQRDSDGVFTFRDPSPEPNVLTVTGLPPGMSVQSITFNGKPVSGAVIDLTTGGGRIDIVIGPSGNR